MTAATNHYDTLGVARTATAAEIKRAYFKLVRVHSPENDPDGFRRITEAYTVLSDPEARKAYDAEVPIPPDLAARIDAAAAICESSPRKAVSDAERLLHAPDLPDSGRFAVAVILMRAARPDLAVPVAAGLAERHPDDARQTLLHARALVASDHAAEAISILERFLSRHPGHVAATLAIADAIADAVVASADVADALPHLDAALAGPAGGTPDAIPLLIRKTVVLIRSARPDEAAAVAASVVPLVGSGDDDLRRHAAYKWAEVHDDAVRAETWDVAHSAALAALALIEIPELRAVATKLAPQAAAMRELRAAALETDLAEWIYVLISMRLSDRVPPEQRDEFLRRLGDTMESTRDATEADWRHFQRRYPLASRLLDPMRDEARALCGRQADSRSLVRTIAAVVLAGAVVATCAILKDAETRYAPRMPTLQDSFPGFSTERFGEPDRPSRDTLPSARVRELVLRMAGRADAEAGFTRVDVLRLADATDSQVTDALEQISDESVRTQVGTRVKKIRADEAARRGAPTPPAPKDR